MGLTAEEREVAAKAADVYPVHRAKCWVAGGLP